MRICHFSLDIFVFLKVDCTKKKCNLKISRAFFHYFLTFYKLNNGKGLNFHLWPSDCITGEMTEMWSWNFWSTNAWKTCWFQILLMMIHLSSLYIFKFRTFDLTKKHNLKTQRAIFSCFINRAIRIIITSCLIVSLPTCARTEKWRFTAVQHKATTIYSLG